LITGAFGGFGREFIRQLIHAGADLVLSDLVTRPIRKALSQQEQRNMQAGWESHIVAQIAADLSTRRGCDALYEQCCQLGRPIDVVIHNAGVTFVGYFDDVPRDEWERLIQLDLLAPMRLTHSFLPEFVARGWGHFVFIDSVAGFIGTPFGTAYSAAKFGLNGFAMALHGENRRRGLDTTIVYPFFSRTDMMHSPWHGDPPIRTMPDVYIGDPKRVVRAAIAGIQRRKLYVRPGPFSKLLWLAARLLPIIAKQRAAKMRQA
jgi:short-subunit dehydrogenase